MNLKQGWSPFPQLHLLHPCPIISPLYCSCEAAFLQAARPDIQQQLLVDHSVFHSATAMLPISSPAPCSTQAFSGSPAWLWGWSWPLGPKPGLSLQQRTGLCSRPAGLRQEQSSPVQHRPGGGWGAVFGSPRGVEGEGGTGGNGAAGT